MSSRLATALIALIRSLGEGSKFLRIEAVDMQLAYKLSNHWNDDDPSLPRLVVLADGEVVPGKHALGTNASVATLRNENPDGVCVVVCVGASVLERQSINSFTLVSPGDLLIDKNRLSLLAQGEQSVLRDGHHAAVREAIVELEAGVRPNAMLVSNYFDCLADGAAPLEVLPLLKGFADPTDLPTVLSERIKNNLELAAGINTGEIVSSEDYATIRRRADVVFRRVNRPEQHIEVFMQHLQSGSQELFACLTYEQAREIFTPAKLQLHEEVRKAVQDYRSILKVDDPDREKTEQWELHFDNASNLAEDDMQRDAAVELVAFDQLHDNKPFNKALRNRIERLLRAKRLIVDQGQCFEVAMSKIIQLNKMGPTKIEVITPEMPENLRTSKQSRDWLTLAVARMRLGTALSFLDKMGCEVDTSLKGTVLASQDNSGVRDMFCDADLLLSDLSPLRLRIQCNHETTEMDWRPDIDDLALLRAALEFSDTPALTLEMGEDPDARTFVATRRIHSVELPESLTPLSESLQLLAADILKYGLQSDRLLQWTDDWADFELKNKSILNRSNSMAEAMLFAGYVVRHFDAGVPIIAMTGLAPLKAEWLARYLLATQELLAKTLAGSESKSDVSTSKTSLPDPNGTAGQALNDATASHYPAFVRTQNSNEPLLAARESRLWSVFGGASEVAFLDRHSQEALEHVVERLIRLQPEVADHLRCIAVGAGAVELLLEQALRLAGRRIKLGERTRHQVRVRTLEIFSIGAEHVDNPRLANALRRLDQEFASRDDCQVLLRHFDDLYAARKTLGTRGPVAHLALFAGLDQGDWTTDTRETRHGMAGGDEESEVLFSPRLSLRANTRARSLLSPPTPSSAMKAFLRLAQRVEGTRVANPDLISVPELRVKPAGSKASLLNTLHELATWVVTLDPHASRESLEKVVDNVAILHQERRLGSESPVAMVVSQRAGGPVDSAIGRSLRKAGILPTAEGATELGQALREVAAQGYGVLALEAATTGTGVNELVSHVVGFSLLATEATPWPLPAECRLLLIGLDEYADWFHGGKRADLLVLAIDNRERGVHAAVTEVKTRRSADVEQARGDAFTQIQRTLMATAPAAQPDVDSIESRVWLNRIAEALYSVARESQIELDQEELDAVEEFRQGRGTLEWAGLGLVFGPDQQERRDVRHTNICGDPIPIAMQTLKLTQELLEQSASSNPQELRTVATEQEPLGGGRIRRRPESGSPTSQGTPEPSHRPQDHDADSPPAPRPPGPVARPKADTDADAQNDAPDETATSDPQPTPPQRSIPILGHSVQSGDAVEWRIVGPESLSNGHVQVWGSSGAGKTQFVKMLLAQLATGEGANFGIADFKNDYGPTNDEDFPSALQAQFYDMWGKPGAPFNPLALDDGGDEDALVIEFRDAVEQAMLSYQKIGARQRQAIEKALRAAYEQARPEGRHPTMMDLNAQLSDRISHILDDLTKYRIFDDGPPLRNAISERVVFGLSKIPGTGQTTVLAAAFLLSSVSLAIQALEPVANQVRYALVVDEAHRVSKFKAVDLMVREGRSKGLAVILATQSPSDLPPVVDTNAQTRVCFRLSDASVAEHAAQKLDPNDSTLPERIRTLATGQAFVSLEGSSPRLVDMVQYWRDHQTLTQ